MCDKFLYLGDKIRLRQDFYKMQQNSNKVRQHIFALFLKRHQMDATMAKAMITKSKHPSSTSVSLDSLGENNSGPLVEAVPSRDVGIEVPSILRRSVAFMESKLLFDPGGEHTYENEYSTNEFEIPDTFDGGKYSTDVLYQKRCHRDRKRMKEEWNQSHQKLQ